MIIQVSGTPGSGKTRTMIKITKQYDNILFISTEENKESLNHLGLTGTFLTLDKSLEELERISVDKYDAIFIDNPLLLEHTNKDNIDMQLDNIQKYYDRDIIYSTNISIDDRSIK